MRQNTARKLLGLLLALAMVAALVPGIFLTALAEAASVRYVDAKGKDMGTKDCLPLTQSTTTLNNAWYVVNQNVTFENNRLAVKGNVNLILADGCTLNASQGIRVLHGNSLTIWAQSTGDNKGRIEAKSDSDSAAIGGDDGYSNGKITINGGTITTESGLCAAGIGSGYCGDMNSDITINGGAIIITKGNINAPCIGSGRHGDLNSNITITGGDITCVGNQDNYSAEPCIGTGYQGNINLATIRISGGTLNLKGGLRAPAIGAGGNCTVSKNAKIIIDGGTIIATGGKYAPGIGGGMACKFLGTIEISGGHVTATGGSGGAGIGVSKIYRFADKSESVESGFEGTIRISDGTVIANGTDGGAGIGTDEDLGFDGTVIISGGTVTATGDDGGAGIGGGDDGHFGGQVTVNGGEVTATGATGGAGIGGGYGENGNFQGNVTITGGSVTATGGPEGGAGIGSGLGGSAADGHVYLYGGTVIAKGGTGAAGIGGGKESGAITHWNSGGEGCNDVRISSGTVFAQSGEGNCSAIGHGDDDGHMGNISFTDGLRVQTDSRTDGDIDGPYSNRDGNPYQVDERDGACMYNHTVLISACDHPVDAGINDSFVDITETYHQRAACVYCGHALQREAHTLDAENKCTVCGYQDTVYTVSFDANGGSGSMGVMKAVPERAITLPECGFTAPSTGYVFAGWDIDGLIYDAGAQVEIKQDTTAKATWTDRVIAYPLWVGGVRVNENNAEDILGDGTASYDRLNNILTLNGAWINRSAVYDRVEGLSAGIINAQSQLQVVVEGNSVVNVADADYGIYSLGALSISGEGRLIARGKDGIGTGGQGEGGDIDVSVAKLTATGDRYGVNATGNIIVHDSTVDATGGESGLRATKNIGVNGESSVVTARATGSGGQALQAAKDIGFDSFLSIVTPTGGTVGAGSDGFTVLDRQDNAAREVMISKNLSYDVWVGQTQVTSDNYRNVLGDGSVRYDPDTHTLTFAAAAPAINGNHNGAMIYAGHGLNVVAPEGGLTLENADADRGIDAAGNLRLRGDVTVNVMKQAIFAGEDFSVYGNLTARSMGSELTAEGLVVANGYIYIDGDLKGYNRTGYGLHAEDDIVVTGDVQLNVATGTTISAGAGIDIEGSLDNTGFDGQTQVPENGVVADDDIYLGSNVTLLASNTGIRSDNGNIALYAERWEVNDATHGAVAIDAVKIYLPETSAFAAPEGGEVKAYDADGATRETIYSGDTVAAYAIIGKKADAPTEAPAAPTVQLTPESVALTYGGAEEENRTLTAAATVEPETGLGTLTYRWQRQDADGYWLNVASGVDMTEYAVPTDAAVGEYTYRCLVVNALNGASEQAESNAVTVTVGKAAPEITTGPRATGLTYSGRPQRLAMGGSAVGGTMQYSLDGESWSGSVPTATNAGAYALHYRVLGDENHTDLPDEQLEVSIAKRRLVITVESKEKTVGEADPALTYLAEGLVAGDMLEGQLTREAGEEAGTYLISAEAIQPAAYCRENYTVVAQGGVLKIVALAFGEPDFTMPAELAEIQESAFEGLADMKVVDAHGCATIGKDAFKDTGLAQIRLPKDCEIDPEAFGDRKIYVFAPAGGSTEAYCAGHENLEFIAE